MKRLQIFVLILAALSCGRAIAQSSGSGTLNGDGQTLVVNCSGFAQFTAQVVGTISAGQINFDSSNDGTDWTISLPYFDAAGELYRSIIQSGTLVLPATCLIPVSGIQQIRLRTSGGFTGSVTILWQLNVNWGSYITQFSQTAGNPVTGSPVTNLDASLLYAFDLTTNSFLKLNMPDNATADNQDASTVNALWVSLIPHMFRDSTHIDGVRTPTIFKTVQATASGNTAVWTPTAGKKFRLMRYRITLTENAIRAAAGVITVQFEDSATLIGAADDVWVNTTAPTGSACQFVSPWIDLGNGILSAASNDVLNINLSAALTAGNFRIDVCGTEE